MAAQVSQPPDQFHTVEMGHAHVRQHARRRVFGQVVEEVLAVDEIQLVADPERGHVFTQRLLHARGRFETMFLGAGTAAPLIRRLVPDVEVVSRERLSTLSYAGSKKITRLPRRSAIVESHGGQLVVGRSAQGGAAFSFRLPRTLEAAAA